MKNNLQDQNAGQKSIEDVQQRFNFSQDEDNNIKNIASMLPEIKVPAFRLVNFSKKGLCVKSQAKTLEVHRQVNLFSSDKLETLQQHKKIYASKKLAKLLQNSKGKLGKNATETCQQHIKKYHLLKRSLKTINTQILKSLSSSKIKNYPSMESSSTLSSKLILRLGSLKLQETGLDSNTMIKIRQRLKTDLGGSKRNKGISSQMKNQSFQDAKLYKKYEQLSFKQIVENESEEELHNFRKVVSLKHGVQALGQKDKEEDLHQSFGRW